MNTNLTDVMKETLEFDRNDKYAIKHACQALAKLEVTNAVLMCRNTSGEQPNSDKFEEYIREGILLFLFWADKAPGFKELHQRVELAWYGIKALSDSEYRVAFDSPSAEGSPFQILSSALHQAQSTMTEYVDEL